MADPVSVGAEHVPQLKTLVELYPQSGLLRALLARAIQFYDENSFQQKLRSAAVYAPDRGILYNLINYPEKLEKYAEPLTDLFEDEGYYEDNDPGAYYADHDQQMYHPENTGFEGGTVSSYTEGAVYEEVPLNNLTETPVYEEGPVNYFHDPEESFRPEEIAVTEGNYGPLDTVIPQHEQDEVQETITYYHQNILPDTPVEPATGYEYFTAENYIAPGADATVENYTEPVHYDASAEAQQNYYEAPAYSGFTEEQQPDAYTFNDPGYFAYQPEGDLPPIPGYHKPDQEQENVNLPARYEIDDEVYDEITGIEDIYIEPINLPRQDYPTEYLTDNSAQFEVPYGQGDQYDLVYEAPASTNVEPQAPAITYDMPAESKSHDLSVSNFRDRLKNAEQEAEYVEPESDEIEFEMVTDTSSRPEAVPSYVPAPSVNEPVNIEPQFAYDDGRISKYNDDKMPYSFMWWLDKTRKEHATNHQPYAPFEPVAQEAKRPAESDELQQQYFENIFHLTSVEQLDRHTRSKRKESEIIDRFIQQDPQLKAPNTDKLDNENKAKKSSEDDDEVVSETLARIYTDQMLFPKAISTYQKLLLKFPEKSSYFVAQIKLLEKKIN